MAVGGDLIEITYNHPTIGTGTWFGKSGEDTTFDPGGIRTADDANNVDGGGRNIRKLNRVQWSFEGTVSWDGNVANELEQAEALSADPVEADYTISMINGTIWKGKGSPVGDVKANGNAATMAVKLAGGAKMKKISG